jgi:hypothetical protein
MSTSRLLKGSTRMMVKRLLAVSLGSMALIAATSTAASAGEINGTGNPPEGEGLGASHAASVCAFSGLEDGDGNGFPGPGNAPPQSFGQALKAGFFTIAQAKQFGALPGQACNPNTPPTEGGTP